MITPTTARRVRSLIATIAAVAAIAGCGRSRGEPSPDNESVEAGAKSHVAADRLRHGEQIPFEHSWDLKLPSAVHASFLGAEVPEVIFFQVEKDNSIYCVDAMSGHTRWVSIPLPKPINLAPHVHRVTLPGQKADQPVNDDRLYLISDDDLYCFDIAYGQLVWRYHLPFSSSSGPLAVGVEPNLRVYIGDWAGRVECVSYIPEKSFPYVLWQWNVGAAVTAQPIAHEGLVYVGDHKGQMHCFQLDRDQPWTFKAGNGLRGPAAARGRALYFGTTDNVFYAVNRLSGEKLGSAYLNAPMSRRPMVFAEEPNRVYVWTDPKAGKKGALVAIDTQSETIALQEAQAKGRPSLEVERMSVAWTFPGAARLVSSTPDHLYVTVDEAATVQAINRATGKLDWAWKLDEGHGKRLGGKVAHITEYQDPTDLNRSIYTADADGQVVAYRLFGYLPKDRVAAMAGKPLAPTPVAPPKADAKGKKKDGAVAE